MIAINKTELLENARRLGFLDVRVASAVAPPEAAATYGEWIAAGHHGEMTYMERLVPERSSGVEHILPGAKSVLVLAASYYSRPQRPEIISDNNCSVGLDSSSTVPAASGHRVARYALGRDYHFVLKDRLGELIEYLVAEYPGHQWRAVTDSAPMLERAYAAASGLGFIGKNAMLISWMHGSFTLLAEVVTTAEIEPDQPREGTCGNCTRCLDACPTQAFTRPGHLDARKCISYLTIEKKSGLTEAESRATGEWAFGCDICQDVCPYNKQPDESLIPDFAAGTVINQYEPAETFLDPESNSQFERRFPASPLLRAGKRRIQKLVRSKS